eukprot:1868200-Pyramimonas_sp.AAC.1
MPTGSLLPALDGACLRAAAHTCDPAGAVGVGQACADVGEPRAASRCEPCVPPSWRRNRAQSGAHWEVFNKELSPSTSGPSRPVWGHPQTTRPQGQEVSEEHVGVAEMYLTVS